MLHDIGIIATRAPEIECHGDLPYICHGVEGRKMLEAEGLPHHALVAERHTGVGISRAEIIENDFPVPRRDMLAVSLEEQIISWADLFYGKDNIWCERSESKIKERLAKFGAEKVRTFEEWQVLFGNHSRG